ncbi:hypothetical protein [Magnetospirillum sulfuroxidans]|uniref:Uncharacterized protein n=1 Tax=Magnetospirillum sulfuroxidans TaxID=611300 RepID=A0ABS5ICF5_9PROT|nr:hypothetical protein [Magnetospirillum sulfuroxidans]MBR9972107.1 hypothetical protein [Magnetospirillum sulfuroxidans]
MKVLHQQTPFSVIQFQGRIEAIKVARQFSDGTHIAYLRINEEGEGVNVLQNISVGNSVGSYLKEGEKCTLYAIAWDGRGHFLYAAETQGRQVYDRDELERFRRSLIRQVALTWGSVALFGVLMTLLVLFLYFGIPLAIWAGWKLRQGLRRARFPLNEMHNVLIGQGWKLDASRSINVS